MILFQTKITGWSKETVTSNLFLTGPKISKSVITQWFLGAFIGQFWYFDVSNMWGILPFEHLLHYTRPEHSYTPLDASKPRKRTYTPLALLCSQNRHRHQATLTDVPRHPKRLFENVFRMTSNGVLWCLLVSVSVSCCLEMWGGCLRSFSEGIWVLFMDVYKVLVHLRVLMPVWAFYGEANAVYWESF